MTVIHMVAVQRRNYVCLMTRKIRIPLKGIVVLNCYILHLFGMSGDRAFTSTSCWGY